MSVGVAAGARPAVGARSAGSARVLLPVGLWLAAALVSGFTLRRGLVPLDEGLLQQVASRMADGQWPWRHFSWAYGPGQPLVVAGASEVFGPSVLWWRLLRVAADATAAVVVWALVRDARPAEPGWALAAWAGAAVTAAQPAGANPAAPALAFALIAVWLAGRARPGWAGVAVAASGFWRPDFGACAAVAAAAVAWRGASAPGIQEGSRPGAGGAAPAAGVGASPAAGVEEGARTRAGGASPAAGFGASPAAGIEEGARAGAGGASRAAGFGVSPAAGSEEGSQAGAGRASPAAGIEEGARTGAGGASRAAGFGTSTTAGIGDGVGPEPARRGRSRGLREAGVCLAVAVVVSAVGYLPFALAAGPDRLWDALVIQAGRDGDWWRLPFPAGYDGRLRAWPPGALAHDLKDVADWLAPYAALVAVVAAAIAGWRRTPGLLVLALGMAVYLRSRADEDHVQPLLVVVCALAPIAAVRASRWARVVLVSALALLLAVGAANRLSALLRPPDLVALHLPGVPGIGVPREEADALPRVVALVQRLVPPGDPIYVAPRRSDLATRSDPLLHFLVRRPNVLHRDVLLQAKPEEQARIVAALRRARPRVVIRWTDPASSAPEPNLRGRPSGSRTLDAYLAGAYRLRARLGRYDVLVRA